MVCSDFRSLSDSCLFVEEMFRSYKLCMKVEVYKLIMNWIEACYRSDLKGVADLENQWKLVKKYLQFFRSTIWNTVPGA